MKQRGGEFHVEKRLGKFIKDPEYQAKEPGLNFKDIKDIPKILSFGSRRRKIKCSFRKVSLNPMSAGFESEAIWAREAPVGLGKGLDKWYTSTHPRIPPAPEPRHSPEPAPGNYC